MGGLGWGMTSKGIMRCWSLLYFSLVVTFTLPSAPYHNMLPHYRRLGNNRVNRPWTETSGTICQNKPFLFLKLIYLRYLSHKQKAD
jgi:hypothetical protein